MEPMARKFRTFEEADQADRAYYRALSPSERVRIVLELMERSKAFYDDPPQGLERVCRIIKLSQH